MTVIALIVSIILSTASLAWGFSAAGLTSVSLWILILGALWLAAIWQNWDWFSSPSLVIVVIAAAFGLWLRLAPGWMFAGGIFALTAWDMHDMRRRLRFVVKNKTTREEEKRHIAKVTLLVFLGLGLAAITMQVRAQFTFEWTILLVLTALLGLSQLLGWLKKEQ